MRIMMSGGNLIAPRKLLLVLVCLVGISAFGFASVQINRRNAMIYGWLSLVMLFGVILLLNGDPDAIIVRLLNFTVSLGLLRIYVNSLHRSGIRIRAL
jgi:hypothetical protein